MFYDLVCDRYPTSSVFVFGVYRQTAFGMLLLIYRWEGESRGEMQGCRSLEELGEDGCWLMST